MKFQKYHALGNDYLVLAPEEPKGTLPPESIVRICHRNFGLGSDGILLGPLPSKQADFALKIFNPDGSEAEKSGNGLRIFSRYLFDCGLVKANRFTVETLGGVVECRVEPDKSAISVEMGTVSFISSEIPVSGPQRAVLDETIEIGGETYRYYGATIGNPHCVLPMERISEALARSLGPKIETHDLFPKRTNVQFMKVVDRGRIAIEIWERGAGYTLASGSSSSAAAAVARKMGACDREICVEMPGGELLIEIDDDFSVKMTGPVTAVGSMELDDEALNWQ